LPLPVSHLVIRTVEDELEIGIVVVAAGFLLLPRCTGRVAIRSRVEIRQLASSGGNESVAAASQVASKLRDNQPNALIHGGVPVGIAGCGVPR
jgi:hypothetical protein